MKLKIDYSCKNGQAKIEFTVGQTFYFVKKKLFGRVQIVKDKIQSIIIMDNGHYFCTMSHGVCFEDCFTTKEEAYDYAETLIKRRKIKLKELC